MKMYDHSTVSGASGSCLVVCHRSTGAESHYGDSVGIQAVFKKVLAHGPGSHD